MASPILTFVLFKCGRRRAVADQNITNALFRRGGTRARFFWERQSVTGDTCAINASLGGNSEIYCDALKTKEKAGVEAPAYSFFFA